MISLRYHIVSVVAVFLALGLGIVLGSSVVSTPLDARLNDDVQRYKDQRDEAKAVADELTAQNDQFRHRIADEIAPWSIHGRLTDRSVVFVVDGPQAPKWREHVLDALTAAGAKPEGSILLSERWSLEATEDADDLVASVRSVVPTFEPKTDVAASAAAMLGERFLEPTGRALVDVLARDGFMTVQGRTDADWPPSSTAVVLLSSARTDEGASSTPGMLSFARRVAEVTPTLGASDVPADRSLVSDLRDSDGLSDTLATFDSATNDSDPGGIGVVAAFVAAIEGRGGHFGAERGRTFVAPPGPDS